MDRLRANVGTLTYATQRLVGVLTGHDRPPERRAAQRFPIECNTRYWVMGRRVEESGRGKTLNISSNGILVTTDRILAPGLQLEVEIEWPVRLDGRVSLKLVVQGKIVRSTKNDVPIAGIKISRHTFRTFKRPL